MSDAAAGDFTRQLPRTVLHMTQRMLALISSVLPLGDRAASAASVEGVWPKGNVASGCV